ncbi:MAG: M23 family metallopeptidase [Salinivirgaceae bacterium]|nr:M23 family metallopeptidase [Salinivirgaceae bacterium]
MDKAKKKNKFAERYRITILNNRTLKEVWNTVLSLRGMIVVALLAVVLLVGIGVSLISFTPLRKYVPGYPSDNERFLLIDNYMKVDSLEKVLSQSDLYFDNLQSILVGKNTKPHFIDRDSIKNSDSKTAMQHIRFDSSLYKQIDEDQFNIHYVDDERTLPTALSTVKIHFYCPLKGDITNPHSPETGHYGVDIVSDAKDPILSVLDGTVIMAGWTLEAGYVIVVQHRNNIVSQYKHNSFLLKKIGDHVRAGEPLGFLGNTGEYTTGPHLHFELWQNGTPLNPTDYIIF